MPDAPRAPILARVPPWVALGGTVFLAYFGLLIYCDIVRPGPEGMGLSHDLRVVRLVGGGAADRAGVRADDRVTEVDGYPIDSRMDWGAAMSRHRVGHPLRLGLRRGHEDVAAVLDLGRAPWTRWLKGEGVGLAVARLVQAVSLCLGLLVALRRPRDPLARLGAWLLATIGVYAIALPVGIAAVWSGLPGLIGLPLWVPYTSTLMAPAILLAFFLTFAAPRPWRLLWMLPMVPAVGYALRYRWETVYGTGFSRLSDGWLLLEAASAVYLVAAGIVAVRTFRTLSDVNERRRFTVILAGALVGCVGCVPIAIWYYAATEPLALFGSPVVAIGTLSLLAVPLSFTYAILRHRLFDLRLIVRMGVRYALARRLLLSVAPAAVALFAIDLSLHSDRPIGQWFAARASVYALLFGVSAVARSQRQRWLDALDRRFFRERYDATRILTRVAQELGQEAPLERSASRVVEQIGLALHPRFAALLVHVPAEGGYRLVASSPPGSGPARVPADGTLAALARVLGAPLDVSPAGARWLSGQLSTAEKSTLADAHVELIVPVPTTTPPGEALLVLGPRMSEEPYSTEDLDLLQAVAERMGPALARAAATDGSGAFAECRACGYCGTASEIACPVDGQPLVRVNLPRLLGGRYHLDRRLGRGGMGTVYGATDQALNRTVAVKVVREELIGNLPTAQRFHREARTVAAFSHPNVVTIHDFGIAGSARAYLVMELLAGRTLRGELDRRERLPEQEVLEVLGGICAAVDAAHRRQLVHRDLKPENVYLAATDAGRVTKVLDFGIAKGLLPTPLTEPHETGGESVVGTPSYMAPEQLRGEAPAASWDLWALAVMTCEMLTGRHPFTSVQFGAMASDGPPPHESLVQRALAGCPTGWTAFLVHALAIDPARRPTSAAEFLAQATAAASPLSSASEVGWA